MKIRTYTDPVREVPDGFTCENCGAIRNDLIGKGKSCAAFRRTLLIAKDGDAIKAFECALACRTQLIEDALDVLEVENAEAEV